MCSAFHVPRSAFGRGGEDPYRRWRNRRSPHARARPGAGAARGAAGGRAGTGRRAARYRGPGAPAPAFRFPPRADRADPPPRLVAQPAMAPGRVARVARRGADPRGGAAGGRDRHGRLRGGARRAARAARRHPDRRPGAERVSRAHVALARRRGAAGGPPPSRGGGAGRPGPPDPGGLPPQPHPPPAAPPTAELCAWGKPSVLVPLPTAAAGHQTFNARALAAAGAAVLLPEEQLAAQGFAQLVRELVRDEQRLASLAARARERGHPDAARDIVLRILTLVV